MQQNLFTSTRSSSTPSHCWYLCLSGQPLIGPTTHSHAEHCLTALTASRNHKRFCSEEYRFTRCHPRSFLENLTVSYLPDARPWNYHFVHHFLETGWSTILALRHTRRTEIRNSIPAGVTTRTLFLLEYPDEATRPVLWEFCPPSTKNKKDHLFLPCEKCSHTDCHTARDHRRVTCHRCSERVGYNRPFLLLNDESLICYRCIPPDRLRFPVPHKNLFLPNHRVPTSYPPEWTDPKQRPAIVDPYLHERRLDEESRHDLDYPYAPPMTKPDQDPFGDTLFQGTNFE